MKFHAPCLLLTFLFSPLGFSSDMAEDIKEELIEETLPKEFSEEDQQEICWGYLNCNTPKYNPYPREECSDEVGWDHWRYCSHPEYRFPDCFMNFWQKMKIYGSGEAGYKQFRMPGFNLGSLSNLVIFEPYPPFSLDNDYPRGGYASVMVGFEIPWVNYYDASKIGEHTSVEFTGNFFSGDDKKDNSIFTIPANRFAVFLDIADPNSPDAIVFASGAVLDNSFVRNYSYIGASIRVKSDYFCNHHGHLFVYEPFFAFEYDKIDQSYVAEVLSVVAAEKIVFEEDVETNYYDFGGGLSIVTPICGPLGLKVSAAGYVSCGSAELHATETLSFIVGTGGFVKKREDFRFATSGKFKGSVELGWRCKRLLVSLLGNYEYWGFIPQIVNPIAPGPQAKHAHIERSFSWNYSFGLKITAPLCSW